MIEKINVSGKEIDVKTFFNGNSCIFRFYNKEYEDDNKTLDLVIVQTDYGYINVTMDNSKVGSLISGYMNSKYFSKESIEEIIDKIEFALNLEESYYHIELVELSNFTEYNGEY